MSTSSKQIADSLMNAAKQGVKEHLTKEIARQRRSGEQARVVEKNGQLSIEGDRTLVERIANSLKK